MKRFFIISLLNIALIHAEGFNVGPQTESPSYAENQRFLDYVATGNVEQVQTILQQNPSINVNVQADAQGKTPLIIATELGNEELVKLLLKYGADPRIASSGNITPLQVAEKNDDTFIAGDLKAALAKFQQKSGAIQMLADAQKNLENGINSLKKARLNLDEALNSILTDIDALSIPSIKKKELTENIRNLMNETAVTAMAGYFAFDIGG